jgi:hypothetical protein
MGASGIGHKIILNNKQYIKSTIAATTNGLDYSTKRINDNYEMVPKNKINNKNYSFVLSSFLNTKFNAKHTNKSGFVVTGMNYNILFQNALPVGTPLQTIVDENGLSTLISAYSNSTINLSDKFTMNAGVSGQFFTLNKHYTIEPRIGIKYQLIPTQTISLAYGLHSRLERINYFFTKNSKYGNELINKDLDFTKSHHLVLGYDISISELKHIKVELYYQHLFNVPVITDSSFSIINLQNDWFFNEKLQNTGTGKNYGLDITFEKYLSEGYYYMLTCSVFNSRYKGGDNIWRDTRYDRNFVLNFLIGKEWAIGKSKQNVLGLNARLSYQGGDHYSPINTIASINSQETIFDETKAFSNQFSPAFITHVTASYKINKRNSTHQIDLKIINATSYKEFTGFEYNLITKNIDERKEALMLPNLSYKIEF